MFKNIEKSVLIMLLAIGVKLDGDDEQVKKRKKKICLDETIVKRPSMYRCIPKYISGYAWKIKKEQQLK